MANICIDDQLKIIVDQLGTMERLRSMKNLFIILLSQAKEKVGSLKSVRSNIRNLDEGRRYNLDLLEFGGIFGSRILP